ncbi:NAD(P)-binding protein [Thozetella sp. PMI_491]|nr:NAD(P)-binding protein [Thozetella sp. PMI_491]
MGFVSRSWEILFSYPTPPKADNVIKFGLLGAARIAPSAIITPAKQHPEVVVQAVAARDRKKAAEFAKKHGIPQVHDSYQALLDDPGIDAVYIPLPNGLHYEWTLKALAKGKHVLLEKPSVSNSTEAVSLFRSPLFQSPNAPVLLEAFHYRFQPAWLLFMSLLDRPNIAHIWTRAFGPPSMVTKADEIRFRYDLAGGGMMDLTYTCNVIRTILDAEPEMCIDCVCKTLPPPHELCDVRFDAAWKFPGGVTAEMHGNLQPTMGETLAQPPKVEVRHRPTLVADLSLPEGQEKLRTRKVSLHNFMISNIWHRIDIEDAWEVRQAETGATVKKWKSKESRKAYTFKEAGIDRPSERHWLSYRYQLEEFINKLKGREGSGVWITHDESISQMRMIDLAYAKAGLPLRPTSSYQAEQSTDTETGTT